MELRPYQEKAKRIFEEWNQEHKKTLLVQATGTGKTIVFAKKILVIHLLLQKIGIHLKEMTNWQERFLKLTRMKCTYASAIL